VLELSSDLYCAASRSGRQSNRIISGGAAPLKTVRPSEGPKIIANVQTLTTLPRQEFPGYLHVRLDCVYRIHWNLRKFRSDRELRDVSNVRHYRGVAVP
jgi:hypothetical protein